MGHLHAEYRFTVFFVHSVFQGLVGFGTVMFGLRFGLFFAVFHRFLRLQDERGLGPVRAAVLLPGGELGFHSENGPKVFFDFSFCFFFQWLCYVLQAYF